MPGGTPGPPAVDRLLEAAAATCPVVRPALPGEEFTGHRPAVCAAPSNTAQVAALLTAVAPLGAVVGIRGGGTHAALGPPARALDLLVDTSSLDEVLQYDPGDQVVRAGAGLRLVQLQQRLAGHGQWLGLDPPEAGTTLGEAGATLGGVVASAASGPRRHRYGGPRDLLLGATVVLADGTCARTGGRVVKNVAGYDLCKLLAGSLGTLAVLTEVTFRLHPRPAATQVVTARPEAGRRGLPDAVAAAVGALHGTRLEPTAVEVDADPHGATLALLFEGLPAAVHQQAASAAALLGGDVQAAPPGWWGRHPWDDVPGTPGLRVAFAPGGLAPALDALIAFGTDAGVGTDSVRVRGRAALGVLEAALPAAIDPVALGVLRRRLAGIDGTAVVTRLGAGADGAGGATRIDRWGPVRGLTVMRAVKDRFDPQHRLSPGRFVGGI